MKFVIAEKSYINLGTIYNLNNKYSDNYSHAILSYDIESEEIVIELMSNWNSTNNKSIRVKYKDPLEVAKEYTS